MHFFAKPPTLSLTTRLMPIALTIAAGLFAPGAAEAAVVTNTTIDETRPAIAYSPDDDEFLVVWQSADLFGGFNLYGRHFDGAGLPNGAAFVIAADLTDNERDPAVAYNPVTKGFAVAYVRETGLDSDIRVHHVARSSTIVLQPLDVAVATSGNNETDPQLAYNSTAGAFVLTYAYEYSATDHDVYAVRFDPTTGAITGSATSVIATGNEERMPDIACATGSASCMVVYQDARSTSDDISSQGLNASTWTIPATGAVVTYGSTQDDAHPTIAADDAGGYLVAWQRAISSTDDDVLAVRLDAAGFAQGSVMGVATQSFDARRPDVAFIDTFGEFYVVWESAGPNSGGDFEIWSRPVSASSGLRAPRRVAHHTGKDNLAPAIALSGDFPDVGMTVWEHVYDPGGPFTNPDTDILIDRVRQSDASP